MARAEEPDLQQSRSIKYIYIFIPVPHFADCVGRHLRWGIGHRTKKTNKKEAALLKNYWTRYDNVALIVLSSEMGIYVYVVTRGVVQEVHLIAKKPV